MSEGKKPEKVIWCGSIQIPVWANVGADGRPWYSMTIQRNFKDKKTGEWNKTQQFSPGDLGDVQSALAEAIRVFRVRVKSSNNAEEVPTLGEQMGKEEEGDYGPGF